MRPSPRSHHPTWPADTSPGSSASALARAIEEALGEFDLVGLGALRDALEDVAVSVAGGEVHRRVDVDGIVAQDPLDDGDGLDEVGPVEGVEEAQRADGVGDRDLVGGLALLVPHRLAVEAQPPSGQLPSEPRVDRLGAELGGLEPLRKAQQEDERLGAGVLLELDEDAGQLGGILLLHEAEPLGPGSRRPPRPRCERTTTPREPTEVLHQRDAQHDRDGPALADRERAYLLVRLHEREQRVALETRVGVGDQADRELVDAGQPLERALREPRQLDAVVGRQVLSDLDDLVLDQVVVVEQPLAGRGDDAPALGDLVEVGVVARQTGGGLRRQLEQRRRLRPGLARRPSDRERSGVPPRQACPVRAARLGTERRS